MRISIAQLNPKVGDIRGNLAKLKEALIQAESAESDLLILPELFLTGYPPKDLLNQSWLKSELTAALEQIKNLTTEHREIGILCGIPTVTKGDAGEGSALFNSAVLVYQGEVIHTQSKTRLAAYGAFDEARYFVPAPEVSIVSFKNENLGITIGEDIWTAELWPEQKSEPGLVTALLGQGASVLINISAAPFTLGQAELRFNMIKNQTVQHNVPCVFVNQVGGNDELVFDGSSICFDDQGGIVAQCPSFEEFVQTFDVHRGGEIVFEKRDDAAQLSDALTLGLRDYVEKCGLKRAIIGLSGGLDSAVACVIAVRALGKENVLGVAMPGPFSSPGSIIDARELAENLGIEFHTIPITDLYDSYVQTLSELFAGTQPNVAEENIQARIRGNILMALSNKFGGMVISPGNKSELAVGYSTLYGDMSGGLAVLSDIFKTTVYEIAHFMNKEEEIIPRSTIEKPPSAELRPDQKDEDSLPAYEILDKIIYHYVDQALSVDEIIAQGFDRETVEWAVRTINRAEYKRRQAAPGLKVTSQVLGGGRRMPIAAQHEV